jgi:hypothetical protein
MDGPQPGITPPPINSPDAPVIGDSGHLIEIEPMGESGVKVNVTYQGDRAEDKKILLGTVFILGGLVALCPQISQFIDVVHGII